VLGELTSDADVGLREALRRSMLALIEDRGRAYFPHPAAWAPFVIVGEGGRRERDGDAAAAAVDGNG
jgi:hypothetical protein